MTRWTTGFVVASPGIDGALQKKATHQHATAGTIRYAVAPLSGRSDWGVFRGYGEPSEGASEFVHRTYSEVAAMAWAELDAFNGEH